MANRVMRDMMHSGPRNIEQRVLVTRFERLLFVTSIMLLCTSCKDEGPNPVPPSPQPTLSLHEAAARGDIEQLNKHFALGTNLDSLNNNKSALFLAAEAGQTAVLVALLNHHANKNLGDKSSGRTPLHPAAVSSDAAMIKTLLDHGADVSAVDSDGNSPIHLAAQGNKPIAVKALLDAGADPKARNKLSKSAWRLAVEHDARCESARLLAEKAGPMVVAINSNPAGATVRIGARYEQITGADGKLHWVRHAEEGRVAGKTPCRIEVTHADEGPEGGISVHLELSGYMSMIGGVTTGDQLPNGTVVSRLEPGFLDEKTYTLNKR